MSDNSNIDRLFQESFKDFEVEAPKGSWSNIEKRLTKKNNKPVIPIWQKLTGVAAIIAIIILAGSQWFISSDSKGSVVVSPQDNIIEENNQDDLNNIRTKNAETQIIDSKLVITDSKQNEGQLGQDENKSNVSAQFYSDTSNQIVAAVETDDAPKVSLKSGNASYTNNRSKAFKSSIENKNEETSNLIAFLSSETIIDNNLYILEANTIESSRDNITKPALKSLIDVAQQIKDEKLNTKEFKEKPWSLKPQIAPVFYGNLGSGSALDQSFDENSAQGDVNMSYGLNIAYKLNDKFKIRTGVNRVNLNYNTNDVIVLPFNGISSFSNVDVVSGFESSLVNAAQLSELQDSQLQGRSFTEESQLQQQIGFIEIPMEIEYKLLDKTIDINIIGGASTLLLNNNSLDVKSGESTIFLGEANNINNLSFSTNFAIGLDYDISEKLILNLEPTFKYQFNTFQSGTTNFQPFFIGIYSGLIFRF